MRIPDRQYISSLTDNLALASRQVQKLTSQVSSGKRLTRPSDDAPAAGRILRSQAALTELNNRREICQTAQRQLGIADNALGEIASSLRRVHDIALQGAQSTSQPQERAALAVEVRGIVDHLRELGNASDGFTYVFSGRAGTSAPLMPDASASGGVKYTGDTQPVEIALAPGSTASIGVTGAEIFNFADPVTGARAVSEMPGDVFTALHDLAAQLDSQDGAGEGRGGPWPGGSSGGALADGGRGGECGSIAGSGGAVGGQ